MVHDQGNGDKEDKQRCTTGAVRINRVSRHVVQRRMVQEQARPPGAPAAVLFSTKLNTLHTSYNKEDQENQGEDKSTSEMVGAPRLLLREGHDEQVDKEGNRNNGHNKGCVLFPEVYDTQARC